MTMTREQASRHYFLLLLEISADEVMLRRIARICRDPDMNYLHADVAREADLKAWQLGYRPRRGWWYRGEHRAS